MITPSPTLTAAVPTGFRAAIVPPGTGANEELSAESNRANAIAGVAPVRAVRFTDMRPPPVVGFRASALFPVAAATDATSVRENAAPPATTRAVAFDAMLVPLRSIGLAISLLASGGRQLHER